MMTEVNIVWPFFTTIFAETKDLISLNSPGEPEKAVYCFATAKKPPPRPYTTTFNLYENKDLLPNKL